MAFIGSTLALAGCQGTSGEADFDDEITYGAMGHDAHGAANAHHEAQRLFEEETFGGNGRTCLTCHSRETGTVSPAEAAARFAVSPNDPLFLHDGSDDGEGEGSSRMRRDATVLITLPLPENVAIAGSAERHITVRRGIPTTLNTPALDDVLMYDGRAPDLEAQAFDAISGHAQTEDVNPGQRQLIAQHQQTDAFFSSDAVRRFADGDLDTLELPEGNTEAEIRGRVWFEGPEVFDPENPQGLDPLITINQATDRKGLCSICHSGPLLNTSNGRNPLPMAPFPKFIAPGVLDPDARCDVPATALSGRVPAGNRFQSVLVAELNAAKNPTFDLIVTIPGVGAIPINGVSDPGRALITGNFAAFPAQEGLFTFKIPILRGITKTAPYFHDNSAKTLEAVVDHYATFFALATGCAADGDPPLVMTEQDKADLVAFMKLL